jgi:DNA (cytosine-5)-methyltransferase 1
VVPFTNIGLFAGAGGLELGLRIAIANLVSVCYVERDPYAASVLVARMEDKTLDTAPIWDDITTFDGKPWRGQVDLLSGGFPCQDLSVAGKRAGIDGERSGLWAEFARIIGEIRPRFVFIENVSGLLANEPMRRILGDLSSLGFSAEWECFRASDVGAPHRRERVFILAMDDSGSKRRQQERRSAFGNEVQDEGWSSAHDNEPPSANKVLVDANTAIGRQDEQEWRQAGEELEHVGSERLERRCEPEWATFGLDSRAGEQVVADADMRRCGIERVSGLLDGERQTCRDNANRCDLPSFPPGPNGDWASYLSTDSRLEPSVLRGSNGLAYRNDRLRLTGNGVVPLQAAAAFTILFGKLVQLTTQFYPINPDPPS